ncbi:MAG: LPS export ABC transporter periplasmic protein LptC [Bacteroidales bacterium]|nr:LPS export ABC transporter periplasmic protein LptC [Bacteroidales bacterium]
MQRPGKINNIYISIAVLLTGAAIFLSCDRNLDTLANYDVQTLPSLTVKNFETVHTDSGKIQLLLRSPLMERYTREKEPYNEFPQGVEVIFYDGKKEQVASLSARYAKYMETKKMWELRYDVKAMNINGELLETELLYWEEEKELVYTERFIRITGPERIISGTGFQSDTRFSQWEIRNGNAIIYLKNE